MPPDACPSVGVPSCGTEPPSSGKSMMKRFRVRVLVAVVVMLAAVQMGSAPLVHAARCTPYGQGKCNACKNCKYCGHCAKNGGVCSVCR